MNDVRVQHYHLLTVIVNRGKATQVTHIARANGVPGASITLGWGTVHGRLFNFLGINSEDKEIVYMVSDPETIDRALEALKTELQLEKANHGIAYVMELIETSGVHRMKKNVTCETEGVSTMKQLITVIVERGKAEDVMAAAKDAGAAGGTIVNARGSGVHETTKIFNMEVVPEKEIVLILCPCEKAEAIMDNIEREIQIHEPGHGIMYLQPIVKTVGDRQ
jgi:nitrogen regulatory protein PII